jgi:hypothetical protein
LAKKDKIAAAAEWYVNNPGEINREAAKAYVDNLRKGVERVFGKLNPADRYFEINAKAQGNVSRFGAHKALQVSKAIAGITEKGAVRPAAERISEAERVLKAANRYQVTEYNAAVARCRTARQERQDKASMEACKRPRRQDAHDTEGAGRPWAEHP